MAVQGHLRQWSGLIQDYLPSSSSRGRAIPLNFARSRTIRSSSRVRLVEAEAEAAVGVGGQHSRLGRSRRGRRDWAGDRNLPAAETGPTIRVSQQQRRGTGKYRDRTAEVGSGAGRGGRRRSGWSRRWAALSRRWSRRIEDQLAWWSRRWAAESAGSWWRVGGGAWLRVSRECRNLQHGGGIPRRRPLATHGRRTEEAEGVKDVLATVLKL